MDNNRLRPDERYQRDPHFKALVDTMEHAILAAQYTPSELREAVMLAAIRYEMHRGVPGYRVKFEQIDPAAERVDIPPMGPEDIARFVEAMGLERHRG